MTTLLTLIFILVGTKGSEDEASHRANDVFQQVTGEGVILDGKKVALEAPRLSDGQTAQEELRVLTELAGGERALSDLLRDSVTAPFILKVRDDVTEHGKIRHADLTFVVHADLALVKPEDAAREADGKSVEVANMKYSTSIEDEPTLPQQTKPIQDRIQWSARSSAEMLDRIRVEVTNRVEVTRGERSIVIASMTDRRLPAETRRLNFWQNLARRGTPAGPIVPYDGSASFARITQLAGQPGVLVIEVKVAFFEPEDWFDGAAILRSKFAPIAQDQIRRLRRELRDSKK